MNRFGLILAMMFGAGLCAGCQSAAPAPQAPPPASESSEKALFGDWVPIWLAGEDLSAVDRGPLLSITPDGRIQGFGGVNRFFSTLDVQGLGRGAFVLGPIGATKMAGPPERMAMEARFTSALAEARRYEVRDGVLILLTPDGERVRLIKAAAM